MKKLLLLKTLILLAAISSAQIIHVPGDYGTIQEGINAASNGDTVLVDEGTWYENIRFKGKAITVASHYIITGDSADIYNTIIDGSHATDPDSAACFMLVNGEDSTSVIAGFTIAGGTGMMYGSLQAQHGGGISVLNAGGKIINNIITSNYAINDDNAVGGGVSFIATSHEHWAVIKNNKIINNYTSSIDQVAIGGGIYSCVNTIIADNVVEGNSSISGNSEGNGAGVACNSLFTGEGALFLTNNVIKNNYADGTRCYGVGVLIMNYMATFNNNLVSNNWCDNNEYWGVGAVILNPSGKVYVLNNEFRENTGYVNASPGAGGGLSIRDPNEFPVVVDGNLFIDNVAKHGAGFYCRRPYNVLLSNNVFMNDTALIGGGIGLYMPLNEKNVSYEGMLPIIVNNTFLGNKALETGGAIRITGDEGDGLLTFNNIFYENEAMDGSDVYNASIYYDVVVSYSNIDESNIAGYWIGENNFAGDPAIYDDSCHLTNTSICVDAGTSSLVFGSGTYYCPDHDIDGEWRPMNGSADIGADEYAFTGIPEIPVSDRPFNLTVSPNPNSGAVQLRYSLLDTRYLIFEVYSSNGVVVKSLSMGYQSAGEYTVDLDLSDLPDGMYFVRLQAGEMVETAKVILLK